MKNNKDVVTYIKEFEINNKKQNDLMRLDIAARIMCSIVESKQGTNDALRYDDEGDLYHIFRMTLDLMNRLESKLNK